MGRRNGAVRTALIALMLVGALLAGGPVPERALADPIGVSGEVIGADVEGTIWLEMDPGGGSVSGSNEMTVTFDCGGKTRQEHHLLDIVKGRIDGDRIQATAVYVERSGLPKDELSRCKSAYETYRTREDSRRLIGTIDLEGGWASGTLGEYRPTVSWNVSWASTSPGE
jgi:hypothetical protein